LQHHFVRGLLTDKGFTIYQQYNQPTLHDKALPTQ
jgi:hypothetical protein